MKYTYSIGNTDYLFTIKPTVEWWVTTVCIVISSWVLEALTRLSCLWVLLIRNHKWTFLVYELSARLRLIVYIRRTQRDWIWLIQDMLWSIPLVLNMSKHAGDNKENATLAS